MSGAESLPKPSLEVLVQVLATPCYVHLGLVPNPTTGAAEKDLDQARWAIDLLHVLRERIDGSLSDEERSNVDTLMHQLRDAYTRERGA